MSISSMYHPFRFGRKLAAILFKKGYHKLAARLLSVTVPSGYSIGTAALAELTDDDETVVKRSCVKSSVIFRSCGTDGHVVSRHFTTGVFEVNNVLLPSGTSYLLCPPRDRIISQWYDLNNPNNNLANGNVVCVGADRALYYLPKGNGQFYETAISLLGKGSFNYYHSLIEILGRLIYIARCPEVAGAPLLVDEAFYGIPNLRRALEILNDGQRPVLVLNRNSHAQVGRLITATDPMYMPFHLHDWRLCNQYDTFLDVEAVREMVRKLASAAASASVSASVAMPKRIFIARRSTLLRRTTNEDELWPVASKFGFERVYPEDLSLEQQIQLFGQADVVIGNSGAALTNVVFMKPSAKLIYWFNERGRGFSLWTTLALVSECKVIFLPSEPVQDPNLHIGYTIDPEKLSGLLSQL